MNRFYSRKTGFQDYYEVIDEAGHQAVATLHNACIFSQRGAENLARLLNLSHFNLPLSRIYVLYADDDDIEVYAKLPLWTNPEMLAKAIEKS